MGGFLGLTEVSVSLEIRGKSLRPMKRDSGFVSLKKGATIVATDLDWVCVTLHTGQDYKIAFSQPGNAQVARMLQAS